MSLSSAPVVSCQEFRSNSNFGIFHFICLYLLLLASKRIFIAVALDHRTAATACSPWHVMCNAGEEGGELTPYRPWTSWIRHDYLLRVRK